MRATFIIDKEGVVIDTFSTDNLGTPREKASYQNAVSKLV
jgi:hypothetical protein